MKSMKYRYTQQHGQALKRTLFNSIYVKGAEQNVCGQAVEQQLPGAGGDR